MGVSERTLSPRRTRSVPIVWPAVIGATSGSIRSTSPFTLPACARGTVTITSYDTNVADRTVSGMRCSGTSGSLIEGNNVEMIDDDEFAKSATDQARTMDYEVIKDEGGVKLVAAAYDGGSSKIFWADENKGISMELYPFDTLEDAKAAAEQMK